MRGPRPIPGKRKEFLAIVNQGLWYCDSRILIAFIERALDPIWTKAKQPNAFEYYTQYVILLIDILSQLSLAHARPGIVSYLADALDKIGAYIDPGKSLGSAWEATDHWQREHIRLRRASQLNARDVSQTGIGHPPSPFYYREDRS